MEPEPGHFVKCHLYDPEYADPALFDRLPDFRGEPVGTDGTTLGAESESEPETSTKGADEASEQHDEAEPPSNGATAEEDGAPQGAANDEEE